MYNEISTWMNRILQQPIPDEVVAFCLNLYEMEQDQWAMEPIGTETFNLEDMDWACEEVTDFGTRNHPLIWKQEAKWEDVLEEMIQMLRTYLETEPYAKKWKSREGIGIGFADGDITILSTK